MNLFLLMHTEVIGESVFVDAYRSDRRICFDAYRSDRRICFC